MAMDGYVALMCYIWGTITKSCYLVYCHFKFKWY